MKIPLSPSLYPYNKLKEVYYNSFLVREIEDKFFPQEEEIFPAIDTKSEITLMEVPWGCNRKSMVRVLGNPRFIVRSNLCGADEVLFYKEQIHQEKSIIQYHFIKDQFFYAHVDFISSLSSQNKRILEMLEEKYGAADFTSKNKIILLDQLNNKLIVDLSVYLRLDYLCGKEIFIQHLKLHEVLKKQQQSEKLLRQNGYIRL